MAFGEEQNLVLINLIKNSAEALTQYAISQPRIMLSAEPGSEGFRFRVEDNGPGIPESFRQHLFIPFKTHNKRGGTGLGLAIAKQFIESHGGEISMETSSKGTRFSFCLPEK